MRQPQASPSGSEKEPSGKNVHTESKAPVSTDKFQLQIPGITLPKGGGALKQIDEKFQVNTANGTSSFNIPLPLSSNRNGFTPQLSLTYNSGAGNSIFGIGWELALPAISRRTEKKMPRYQDSNSEATLTEEDSFMFSGAEELVPQLEYKNEQWILKQTTDISGQYIVRNYRSRIESGFSRIERIWHEDHGYYWRVTTPDNVTTFFGYSESCRIADPADKNRVYTWLPEFSYDHKGSWIWYEYKAEDLTAVANELHEKNRHNNLALFTNKHLKRIRYGNAEAWYPDTTQPYALPLPVLPDYHFELVLDYGEHDALKPTPTDNTPWETRQDAFSSYRAGFEMRTYRLCKRLLCFHHFPELNGGNITLVNTLDLEYTPANIQHGDRPTELSYLIGVTKNGYIRKPDGSYAKKGLPTMTFDYQWLHWDTTVHEVDTDSMAQAPTGLAGPYQWVDLYNEGISGILTEQSQAWYYKSNLGKDEQGNVRFSHADAVISKPAYTGLTTGILQLLDLEANGQKQLVVNDGIMQGYFEQDEDQEWQPFRAFAKALRLDLHDPNVRFLDVNGDGKPEAVLADQGAFLWWENLGKTGYGAPELTAQPYDEERGPAIIFADQEHCIFLADMNGDGLTDIVRIRNGEICYWANTGYGRFSAKISMSNAPLFDRPDQYNPAFLHLADISGTGATDIIYLGKNKFKAYLNFSGNTWSDATEISHFFPMEQPNEISVIDLLGQGTACIVWSSELPAYSSAPMRYIDLMGGKKPHIMTGYKNGFGKQTTLEYKSSTYWYLQDKKKGTPWITRLAFPVQCVSKVIVTEAVTNVRFTTEYSYHHGYYDQDEREFRGFGRVEQTDTESFETFTATNAGNSTVDVLHQPPVLTKTWYHTGAFVNAAQLLTHFKKEYWYEIFKQQGFTANHLEYALPDDLITIADHLTGLSLSSLSTEEWREAIRACKGMELRKEVFALDAKDITDVTQLQTQATPYSVATHNCHIQLLQQRGDNLHAAFLVKESEAINYHYERHPEDPRIEHSINLKTDEWGNVLESLSIVYPRLTTDELLNDMPSDTLAVRQAKDKARKGQQKCWILFDKNELTNDVILETDYQLRKVWQTSTWEFTGIQATGPIFTLTELVNIFDTLAVIPYQQQPDGHTPQKRQIEQVKCFFYNETLLAPLPPGIQAAHGISYEKYQLAFTPDLLQDIFTPSTFAAPFEVTDADMLKGKYFQYDTNWWSRSGHIQFRAVGEPLSSVHERFYSPLSFTDAFESKTEVFHDPHYLFITRTRDAVGNESKVLQFNYRTLSATRVTDNNDNISAVITDELGMVKASSMEGKDDNNDKTGEEGDRLTGYTEYTEPAEQDHIRSFFEIANAPGICNYMQLQAIARQLLLQAGTRKIYDLSVQPAVVAHIAREQHSVVNPASPLQISFEYSDGMGNVAMKKTQAEPGIAKQATQLPDGSWDITDEDTGNALRWIGSGRMVLNNKGNPVKQYEPYFSVTPAYEDAAVLVESGVTPIMYYDAISRVVRTDLPNGTFTKVRFDAWREFNFDVNDTVKDSEWYKERILLPDNDPEKIAAQKAALHDDTPSCNVLDTLGRSLMGIDHNRFTDSDGILKEEFYYSFSTLDIEGNALSITDARGNTVMQYRYDMLGNIVAQTAMDTGKRWMLNNVLGNPVKNWDERKHEFSFEYDIIHRLIGKRVKGGDGPTPLDLQYEKIIYGEGLPADKLDNLRGRVVILYDTAGKLFSEKYDFKGNLLRATRIFAKDYKQTPDWDRPDPDALLEGAEYSFLSSTVYDALNRAVKQTTPDGNITIQHFNPAGLLEKVSLQQGAIVTNYVNSVDYNEKGQRTAILYGNQVSTVYDYDPSTFRLAKMRSTKNGGEVLQDLKYTYDPSGNITQVEDKAIPTVFFNNQKTSGKSEYTYDALYRLIAASGREQQLHAPAFSNSDNWDDMRYMFSHHAGDPMGLRNYTEYFRFDAAGNITQLRHEAGSNGSWTRDYTYESKNNRLKTTAAGSQTFSYPHHEQHGFMTSMPHLPLMHWNFLEDLQATARQVRNDGGVPETTYYVYDSNGQRVRKITENQANANQVPVKKDERLYAGTYEMYRHENGLERETLHIVDDKQRIAMIDTETMPKKILGIPAGRTSPVKTIRYQMENHLGSVCLEVDQNAAIITYEEYHPYGTTSYQAKNADITAAAKRYRYTGAERDEETGLECHGARYYISWLGRWSSADPSGIDDGLNEYMYVRGRPTIGNDLNGRALNLLAAAIGAGVGALVGGAIEAGVQYYKHGEVRDWGAVGASAAGGAVAGGLAGLSMGGTLIAQAGAAGVASVAGGSTTRALTGQEQSAGTVAQDFAVGVVTFGIVRGGSAAISSIRQAATQQVEQQVVNQVVQQTERQAVTQATQRTGSQVVQQTAQTAERQAVGQAAQQVERRATSRAAERAAARAARPTPPRPPAPRPAAPPRPPAPAPRAAPRGGPRAAAPIGNIRFPDTNVLIRAARGGSAGRAARAFLAEGRNYISTRSFREFMRGADRQQAAYLNRLIASGRVQVIRGNTLRAMAEREGFNAVESTVRQAGHGATDAQLVAITKAAQQTAQQATYVGESRLSQVLNETYPQLGVNATRLPTR